MSLSERPFVEEVADALGLERLLTVPTGGDEFEAERNQWDDGNNVVALSPGVVVAYERNEATNARLVCRGSRGPDDRGSGARTWTRRRPLHDLSSRSASRERGAAMKTAIRPTGEELPHLRRLQRRRDPLPARPRRRAQGRQARGARGAEARRQGDRADLREGLHPDALRLRGRGLRPGRARDLHRPDRLAHGTQGDGEGHRARARADVRRARVPRLRREHRRRARRAGPASRSTTASPTSGIRRRSWRTS